MKSVCALRDDGLGWRPTSNVPKLPLVGIQESAAALSRSREVSRSGRQPVYPLWDMAAILVVSSGFLIAFILWFDNAQTITTNGVFKALTVREWASDPATARLDPSNYLYYPLMSVLCRALDAIGVLPGDPRHQLAIINAVCAGLCLCIIYRLVLHFSDDRLIGWLAALFHFAGAFFFNLSISNEDILPSYMCLWGAMALACAWFPAPNWWRVAAVSTLFTFAWLLEWRLMIPTLPGLLLALAIGPGTIMQRLGRGLLFLGVMTGIAKVSILLWGAYLGNVGATLDLLWTGKGIYTGWGGFTTAKITFLWVGIGQYLIGGANLIDLAHLPALVAETCFSTAFIGMLAVLSGVLLWRLRRSIEFRILAAVFGTTFVVGEFMNLYSQPQDPQMQINVMAWLTIGWAIVVMHAGRWRSTATAGLAASASVILLAYNIDRILPLRGSEEQGRQALRRIEHEVDPARTVFLLHGFEQLVSDMFYAWHGDWTYLPRLKPAPTDRPRVKLLLAVDGFLHRPNSTDLELADGFRRDIERVMSLGYDVIANGVWSMSRDQFISSVSTVATPSRAAAVHQMLHDSFVGELVFTDPASGPYFRLSRR